MKLCIWDTMRGIGENHDDRPCEKYGGPHRCHKGGLNHDECGCEHHNRWINPDRFYFDSEIGDWKRQTTTKQPVTLTKTWVQCEECEDGYSYHDCGEDTCCCLNPELNVVCDTCEGKTGWYIDEWFGESIGQDELDQILIARKEKDRIG